MLLECGCEINSDTNIFHLPDCKLVWRMLGRGLTAGVFQLETSLGKVWTKRLKPNKQDDLTAMCTILRPGCLEAKDENDVSITKHYVSRKNSLEDNLSLHPALDEILKSTYNQILYQEQIMAICQKIAGFDAVKADEARSIIGKKKVEKMDGLCKNFLDGVQKTNIATIEDGKKIFDLIRASGRYIFNKSHAASYGIITYTTAWLKSHFPADFFTNWLILADEKIDKWEEIDKLINEAKIFGIKFETPSLWSLSETFHCVQHNIIQFGLRNIKQVGDSVYNKILSIRNSIGDNWNKITWNGILSLILHDLPSNSVENLIKSGSLRTTNMTRNRMLFEYNLFCLLTPKEIKYFKQNFWDSNENLDVCLTKMNCLKKHGGMIANERRQSIIRSMIDTLNNPPRSLEDSTSFIANSEREILGFPITFHETESKNNKIINTYCNLSLNYSKDMSCMGVKLINYTVYKTNKKQDMAFLCLQDKTGNLENVVMFPNVYEKYKEFLEKDNLLLVRGNREKSDSFIVNSIEWL